MTPPAAQPEFPNKPMPSQETIDRIRLAAIVDSSDDAIISKDMNSIITSWNRASEAMLGYKPEEIIGRSVLVLIPPELRHEEAEILRKLRNRERIEHYETTRVTKSGRRLQVSLTISPICDEHGNVIGASKIMRDISDRRIADSLRFQLAAIVESSDDAIVGKDLNGIITSWNAAAERLFEYTQEEIVGKSVLTLIPEHLQYQEPLILAKLRANERIEHFETQRVSKSGRILDVSLTVSPIRDGTGKVVGASKIARDISEMRRAQSALVEAEKLAATGRMAATIAHEINNPLEAVINLAYLLATNPNIDGYAREQANMLLAEVSRVGDITRKTLAFYRQDSRPSEVNVSELMDTLLQLHRGKFTRHEIYLTQELDDAAHVWGFGSELKQVFTNLLMNAVDAIGDGGELRVRVRNLRDHVKVTICDNGHGIPANLKRRIFDAFFTTKSSKGNGLGLWISKSIISKHQGWIRVRSKTSPVGHGTIFSVTLPKQPQPAAVSRIG